MSGLLLEPQDDSNGVQVECEAASGLARLPGASVARRAANGDSSRTARAGRAFLPLSWPKDPEWGY